jgi:cell division protein FtsA
MYKTINNNNRNMGVEKDIIVAVELGSTAIRAIAGKKEPDGTMQILAVAQEEAANAIRKGIVDNIDKTAQAISHVVNRLDEKLNIHTSRIYVGLGGQSLHTAKNIVSRQFADKLQITDKIIDEIKDTNRGVVYPDSEILDVVPQEYRIANRGTSEPVGMVSDQIEAHYMNLVARTSLRENIEKCVDSAGYGLAELLISPTCLADNMLTLNEKRSGCALVDMGADTTTVAVYDGGVLCHLAVIPLGGRNATMDIASRDVEADEAESLKLRYGTALQQDDSDEGSKKVPLSHGRSVEESLIREITAARYEEIIVNIWKQISGKGKLLSGILFTGGASKIRNLAEAFQLYTHCDKQLRLAKGLPQDITLAPGLNISDSDNLYTLMGLLTHGDQSCVTELPAEPEAVQTELTFDNDPKEPDKEPQEAEPERQQQEAKEPEPQPKEPEKPKEPRESLGTKLKRWWSKIDDILTDPE